MYKEQLDVTSVEDVVATVKSYGIKVTVISENGPAGGNPLVELEGTKEAVESWKAAYYSAS